MAVATSGQRHIDAAAAGVPTVASLARDWARRTPHHVAMREKDFGIWQRVHVGHDLEPRARRRPRAARPRRRRRRPGVDPGRGPPRVGDARAGHGRRPRRHRRPLPDQPRRRGRATSVTDSGPPSTSPRTRSRWTRRWPSTAPGPGLRRIVYVEPRGMQGYDDDRLHVLGRVPRARPGAPGRAPRRRSSGGWPAPWPTT